MKLILLSDIHGNVTALDSVINDFKRIYNPEGLILLGDMVNYGMRPNEVIHMLKNLDLPVIANLFGNHEKALIDRNTQHFSTERGKSLLEYTRSILSKQSMDYILSECSSEGKKELMISGKKVLFVHGSLSDPYWGNMNYAEMEDSKYSKFDVVLSGHSHIPIFIEKFYECDSPEYRNKKRTIFVNPGSVGQPRNHNPKAQYAYIDLDNEIYHFNSVKYDIKKEQVLYSDYLDSFYSKRLTNGI